MTLFTVIFLLANTAALLVLPRSAAALPLLVGCCYMTTSQRIEIGPVTLTVIRILVAAGIVRVLLRGERIAGGLCGMDKLMIAWMVWIAASSPLHPGGGSPLVFNLGQAFNIGGVYFLIRTWCADQDELAGILKWTAWLLVPVAVEMVSEHFTGRNMFSIFGGVMMERDDQFRATGPFAHAILAGSVGAACFPLMVSLWPSGRVTALAGAAACLAIVIASNSSGPLMSLLTGCAALLLWARREWTPRLRWAFVFIYLALELVMNRPAYYLIGEIDLTGSSTGWHRARLIESALEHVGEWWLAGADFTRHWMPTGVTWSIMHCDITNYYLLMGVWGGLALTILFVAMVWNGFLQIGRLLDAVDDDDGGDGGFTVWCLGSALFAHAATCISVAYFDQSYIFMFLCLASIASLSSRLCADEDPARDAAVPAAWPASESGL